MKKYIALLLIFTLSLSCTEREIKVYDSGNFVGFLTDIRDTTVFSFFYYGDNQVVDHPLKVTMIGKVLEKDEQFKIVANTTKSTLSSDLYEIPETMTFHAGLTEDIVYIKLKRDAKMLTNEYTLILDIVDYQNVNSASGTYATKVIRVSDIAVKPDWWTDKPIVRSYLGKYSRKKFELFMKVTGVGDLTDMPLGEVRILSLKFQHWLNKQVPAIVDEDNEETMQTTVIG